MDLHQDHRIISELTWNTFRDHLILEYEIPKYDGDLGRPNVYVQLEESIVDRKIEYLMNPFKSQAENQWFTPETFRSILRLRGIESNAKYAEAFYGRKLVFNLAYSEYNHHREDIEMARRAGKEMLPIPSRITAISTIFPLPSLTFPLRQALTVNNFQVKEVI